MPQTSAALTETAVVIDRGDEGEVVGVEIPPVAGIMWAARTKGWVSDADLAEINRLLTRLNELMHQPRGKRRNRLVSLAYVLAPVAAKPLRRK